MKRYELKSATVELRKWQDITEGCTINDSEPQLLKSFDNKEDALEELKKFSTSVTSYSSPIGTLYYVNEFYVEENEYDEDDEWVNGVIWAFSNLNRKEETSW